MTMTDGEKVAVGDVMSRDVLTVSARDSLRGAAEAMSVRRVGSAAVVGPGGSLVGILTERDILRTVAQRRDLAAAVQTSMSDVIATVTPDTRLDEAMRQMAVRRIRHLPVTTSGGRLVGIVSMRDLVGAAVCPDVPDRAQVGLTAGSV